MNKQSMTEFGWVDPAFSRYDPMLAAALTAWIMADPKANAVSANNPAKWVDAGVISIFERSLNIVVAAGATSEPTTFRPTGGKNTILFGRTATVDDGSDTVNSDMILYKQEVTDGVVEVQETALSNCFGSGEWPNVLPVPQRWLGNSDRQVTITNNSSVAVTVRLSYHVAYLNQGR